MTGRTGRENIVCRERLLMFSCGSIEVGKRVFNSEHESYENNAICSLSFRVGTF